MEQPSLFERLGGREGVAKLTAQVVDNHIANPVVGTRFANAAMSRDRIVAGATEFFCTGLSGVETYTGQSMLDVHKGMNISDNELNEVLDDVIAACRSLGIGEQEQAEVLAILYGMRKDVIHH